MTSSFIITLKDQVTDLDMLEIKRSIEKMGGIINHEFSLIKGFTIKVPEPLSIKSLQELHHESILNIEEDKEVNMI